MSLDSFPLLQTSVIPRANVRCFSYSPCPSRFLPSSRTSYGPRFRICRNKHFRLTDFTGFRIPIADPILSIAREDFGSAYEVDKEKPSIRSAASGPRGVLGALLGIFLYATAWNLKGVKLSEYNLEPSESDGKDRCSHGFRSRRAIFAGEVF